VVCVKLDIVWIVRRIVSSGDSWREFANEEAEGVVLLLTGGGCGPMGRAEGVQVVGVWLKTNTLHGDEVIAVLKYKIGRCCAEAGG
jgi:hypothetical protein